MELHPILEENNTPNHNLWYVVSAFGDRPSLRVGHTAVPSTDAETGKTDQVLFMGGANPSECFSDIHILDLATLSWNMVSSLGFVSRYEHISFMSPSQTNKIYVLSGANQECNISDSFVQSYDIVTEKWSVVKSSGTSPSPRTHHTTAVIEDCVYIFSGGKTGAEPVQDRQVYSFNASTCAWTSLIIQGNSPSPRHGHTMSVISNKIYCFGGMAGTKFYNDVHILDIEKCAWIAPKVKKRVLPEPRAAHAMVSLGTCLYVFGGMNKDGVALDDLWKLETTSMQWSQCTYEGPPPAPRLDMACCIVHWPLISSIQPTDYVENVTDALDSASIGTPEAGGASKESSSTQSGKNCSLLMIHGGTDTQGEIFDDCLVYRLD